jgi:hypothetical protein
VVSDDSTVAEPLRSDAQVRFQGGEHVDSDDSIDHWQAQREVCCPLSGKHLPSLSAAAKSQISPCKPLFDNPPTIRPLSKQPEDGDLFAISNR